MSLDQPLGICKRCRANEATTRFSQGGVVDLSHGFWEPWCDRCVADLQLAHAIERAKKIPDLENRLVELGGPFGHVLGDDRYLNDEDEDEEDEDFTVLGECIHGVDLDREFCPHGCRV